MRIAIDSCNKFMGILPRINREAFVLKDCLFIPVLA